MNANGQIQRLLHSLREAIHDAIADSPAIAEVISELEREGRIPTFSVDVSLPEERIADSGEVVMVDGGLFLTSSDESFLRAIGVATAG